MPPTEPPALDPNAPPAAAPAAGTPAPEAKIEGFDSLLSNLLEDVPSDQLTPEQKEMREREEKKKKDADPKEQERVRLADEEEKKKAATPKPAEKPIVRRTEKLKRPDLPIERKEEPPIVPATPARAAATPADEDLIDDERQYIKDAEEAEARLPRFKGLADKARKFVRANIEFIKKHPEDENAEEPSQAYAAFLAANKPVFTPADEREVSEARIASQVSDRAKPEIEKIKDQRFADREEPRIERIVNETYQRLTPMAAPKAIMDAIAAAATEFGGDRNKAFASIRGDFKVELDIVDRVMKEVKADVAEMERLATINPETNRPLATSALLDPSNPKHAHHVKLSGIIRDVCNDYKANTPTSEQFKGGRWFVTKEEYFSIQPSERHRFWTFTNREIMDRALKVIPAYVQAQIDAKMNELKGMGFVRQPRQVKTPPPPPAAKGAPGAPHPTPVPGAGGSDGTTSAGAKLAATLALG